jgi:hypothetical protein
LAEHAGEHERARRFFQALDRFTFACELSVIDNRAQEKRFERAVRGVGDDKQLYGEKGALDLSHAEHMKFIATLNRSRKRDHQRRLLLIRIESALAGGSHLAMTDDVTVEHILPKAGSAWWNERFPDSGLRNELANLLGNLTLVTYEQNKIADNKPYPEKKRIYFNTPGASIHALTKNLASLDEWSLEVIERRHEDLVRQLCEDWGLVRTGD